MVQSRSPLALPRHTKSRVCVPVTVAVMVHSGIDLRDGRVRITVTVMVTLGLAIVACVPVVVLSTWKSRDVTVAGEGMRVGLG